MTKSFINKEYRQHRENVLLEREKSLLPSAQIELEFTIQCNKKVAEIDVLNRQIQVLNQQRTVKNYDLVHFKRQDRDLTGRRAFIKHCPQNDCRGFLSTAWKCGTCGVRVCNHCHDVVHNQEDEEKHVCDPDVFKTIQMVRSTSKTCPGCGILIFKIDGCDQMFCIECHTAFSWRSGKVETGVIHNPHFYEWRRKNGVTQRNVGDVRCGELVTLNDLTSKFRIDGCKYPLTWSVLEAYRSIGHYEAVMRRLATADYNPQLDLDLRILYLRHCIDEVEWKTTLQRRHKKRSRDRLYRDVLDLYTTLVGDVMNEYFDSLIYYSDILDRCDAIAVYCDHQVVRINDMFSCRIERIVKIWY